MINPYNHPNPIVRYGAQVASGVGALRAASDIMGGYAPTMSDVSTAYKYVKGTGRSKYKSTKGRAKRKSFPKKIKGQIKELKRLAESDMGRLIFRERVTGGLIATANVRNSVVVNHSSTTKIEQVLGQLRYYDPAAPTALVTADGTTGSYQKEFLVQRQYSKLLLRNNYQVPCEVQVYCCRPKEDTSITPLAAWSNGIVDSSNGATTHLLMYPSDSRQMTDLWRIEKTVKKTLAPGQECSIIMSDKSFQYDPSLVDSHGLTYQGRSKSGVFLVNVNGATGHDSALAEYGNLGAGIDWSVDLTVEVHYSAGADIVYTYVSNGADTFTNGGIVSNKPVSDNQGYSLA